MLMKFTVKNHKLLGIAAFVIGSVHGIYQLNAYVYKFGIGFILAGVITLFRLFIQGLIGMFGFKVMKSK